MSKRFIDTNIFDDSWFMDLSKDGKLLWIYFITKCNHAGILELNLRLISFQTGIENIETVCKELGKSYIRVNEQLIFIPKFIKYQYPDFPKSNVRQQFSAIQILKKYGLFDEEINSLVTVSKELVNSYDNGHVNDNEEKGVIGGEKLSKKFDFTIYPQFEDSLKKWIDYKKSRKESYKNQQSIDALAKRLYTLSGGDKSIAEEIINQSMANNWAGIFQLNDNKRSNNAKPTNDFRVSVGVQNFAETE
jgi:hypothetical protein